MMPPAVEVIVNASAGATERAEMSRLITGAFDKNGIAFHLSLAETGKEVLELAQRAVRGTVQTIIAGGGDGTINAVASTLVGTDKTFGVLPLGTLNHFAKDLNIPLNLAEAVRTIGLGHTIRIDVGEVNGQIFLNNSSLGLYPSIVRQREERQQRGDGKWFALGQATLAVLRRFPFLEVRLSTEGKEIVGRTPFVFVGNNEYELEGLNLGGRACLNAGRLSLYITRHVGRWGLLRLALRALFGGLRADQDFRALSPTEVWIETRQPRMRVAFDGEVAVLETPLHYRVRPSALRVIVPANGEGQ